MPGSPLNRVSFLRDNNKFLSAAFSHPTASFLLLNSLAPLSKSPTTPHYASLADISPLTGPNPFLRSEAEIIASYNSSVTIPQLVFLGLDERNKAGLVHSPYVGAPYFALDVTPQGSTSAASSSIIAALEAQNLTFIHSRAHMHFPAHDAAIFAQARSLIDWNARNPYCAQCGQPTLSINAGTKRTCPPTDLASVPTPQATNTAAAPATDRKTCITRKGVHNIAFPRTDPTVIVAVVSQDGKRVLLGRQRRWPPCWYSVLAGFIEPAESVEEAVRREVWEESGVKLGRVVVHSTQPWPYPANLMIGAVAQALEGGEEILLEHDPELEDAKWVEFDEVREALKHGTRSLDQGGEPIPNYKEGGLRLPPKTAIANRLLTAVVFEGFLGAEMKM